MTNPKKRPPEIAIVAGPPSSLSKRMTSPDQYPIPEAAYEARAWPTQPRHSAQLAGNRGLRGTQWRTERLVGGRRCAGRVQDVAKKRVLELVRHGGCPKYSRVYHRSGSPSAAVEFRC